MLEGAAQAIALLVVHKIAWNCFLIPWPLPHGTQWEVVPEVIHLFPILSLLNMHISGARVSLNTGMPLKTSGSINTSGEGPH